MPSLFAYVGPGAGFTIIGSGIVTLAVALLVVVGFVWYPLGILWRAVAKRVTRTSGGRLND